VAERPERLVALEHDGPLADGRPREAGLVLGERRDGRELVGQGE